MKKFLFLIILILIVSPAFAKECSTCQGSKCIDLMTSMHDKRATLYNVLNLSCDQQKCKDTIDSKYSKESEKVFRQYEQEVFVLDNMKKHGASDNALKKQEKVVKNINKQLDSINKKYEKELMTILNSEQRAKFKNINKMGKKEIKYCQKQKAFYKRDTNLRPFGEKMYYADKELLCPVHNKWHIFGFKHKKK